MNVPHNFPIALISAIVTIAIAQPTTVFARSTHVFSPFVVTIKRLCLILIMPKPTSIEELPAVL
jgi:hypothetical protein